MFKSTIMNKVKIREIDGWNFKTSCNLKNNWPNLPISVILVFKNFGKILQIFENLENIDKFGNTLGFRQSIQFNLG